MWCKADGWRMAAATAIVLVFIGGSAAAAVSNLAPGAMGPSVDGVAGADVPGSAVLPAPGAEHPLAWTMDASVAALENVAPLFALENGVPDVRPDHVPGYSGLADSDKRFVWQVFLAQAMARGAADPSAIGSPLTAARMAQDGGEGQSTGADDLGPARDVLHLWTLTRHGTPRALLSAGDGATFLLTSTGVLRFEGPGDDPSWMVALSGYAYQARAVDVNDDGAMDVIVSTYAFGLGEVLLAIDGVTGERLWEGLAGDFGVRSWTVTDVDGDGTDEILAVGYADMAAFELTGDLIYSEPLPEGAVPNLSQCQQGACVLLVMDLWSASGAFTDVNADGVEDAVLLSLDYAVWFAFLPVPVPLPSPVRSGMAMLFEVVALDGTSGETLWMRPATPGGQSTFFSLLGAGDFDGDERGDVLVYRLGYTQHFVSAGVAAAWTSVYEIGHEVWSGQAGIVLTRDVVVLTSTCATVACTPWIPLPAELAPMYSPHAMADIDGDGRAEIVTVRENDGAAVIEGRGPGTGPGAPSVVDFSDSVPLSQDWLAEVDVRAVAGADGGDAYVLVSLLEITFQEDAEPELGVVHVAFEGGTATSFAPEGVSVAFSVDPSDGQFYAYDLVRDVWAPLSDDGGWQSEGFRMVPSIAPRLVHDTNDDSVPDILVTTSFGFAWVDGRSGALLGDVPLPLEESAMAVYLEDGAPVVLFRDWADDVFVLRWMDSGDELWRFEVPDEGSMWFRGLSDVTGDGALDVAFDWVDHSGPGWEERLRVWDGASASYVVDLDLDDHSVRFVDVLADRPGNELLREAYPWADDHVLELFVPGETDPAWTVSLEEDHRDLYDANDGYVLIEGRENGTFLEILSGASGELRYAFALAEELDLDFARLMDINDDGFPELMVLYRTDGSEDESSDRRLRIIDWSRGEDVGHFTIWTPDSSGGPVYSYGVGLYAWAGPVVDAIGDLDDDGWSDLVLHEGPRVVVRSAASGEVLALLPGEGEVTLMHDFNGDDVPEVGMVSEQARFRLYAYDDGLGEVPDVPEGPHLVENPETPGNLTDDAAEFFDVDKDKGIPGPALPFVVFALVGFLGLARRRR